MVGRSVTPLIHRATDAELAAAVEANLFALFRALAALPGAELVEGERMSYHYTGYPAPIFNAVWRAHLAPEQIDPAIDEALRWFQAKGAPLASWWFSEHSAPPPGLFERLEAHGFELDYAVPTLALDLDTIPTTLSLPDGFTIVEARDARALDDWAAALFGAYEEDGMPLRSARVWADAALAFGADRSPLHLYVGYRNGQPVATNLLFNGGGVAGMFCIGTIPEARGHGFGTAITLKPLLDARAEGYRYGVLFSSDMGLPLYRKLGFRELGSRIGRYVTYWKD